MKKTRKSIGFLFLIVLLCAAACSRPLEQSPVSTETGTQESKNGDDLETARTTPLGRYPETITFTQAKMVGNNDSNLPEGDTYDDNVYTRCMMEMLNVRCENILQDTETQYNVNLEMMIANKTIPDIMMVSDLDTLRYLVENDMIADLTQAYENCASDRIKDIFNSYEEDSIFQNVTFEGKLMAVPETNVASGPNLIWLRKDWMDALGLCEPSTLDDVEAIVREFIQKDPGNNGPGNTVGLVCDTNICGESGYGNEYQMDLVFAACGAYPKQWIETDTGEIVYGSVQPEMKDALGHLNRWFSEGIIDPDFLFHTSTNILDMIVNGKCGSFFAPWWATNNPLMDAMKVNPDAEWMPYLIATDEDGSTSYYSQNPSFQYVVVRKEFEYPELVFKIISLVFDYMRYEERNNEEYASYYSLNVDPNVRPLAINIDYDEAVRNCYTNITAALEGKTDPDDLMVVERAYYDSCKAYMEHPDTKDLSLWSAWMSRIHVGSLMAEGNLNRVSSLFFGETKTMEEKWYRLQELEKAMYLKIITGEEPLAYFDQFVKEWNEQGGAQITAEVGEKCRDR